MDSHSEGVVLVSFGSSLKPSKMSKKHKEMFYNAFRRLSMSIIWKWDDNDLSRMPGNVLVRKWLPQNDLLAHPNLKVLVTHGGLLSLQEALYHSVPIVGIPLGSDQDHNMIRAERNGFALTLDFPALTEDAIVKAVETAYEDKSIHENIRRMHNVFVGRGINGLSPAERALKAVDFAIKSNTVNYVKPERDLLQMPFYITHGYDIFLISIISALIIFKITLKFVKICLKKLLWLLYWAFLGIKLTPSEM